MRFLLVQPSTVTDTLEALQRHGEDAKIIAGGTMLVDYVNILNAVRASKP